MSTDDYLWQHLKGVPAFRALLRAIESRFYHGLELPRPVLDLGCGDGHFAATTFAAGGRPEVGLDPNWRLLAEAQDRQVYAQPVQAAGRRLPFADGHFGSVISNSVLEHIPEVDSVLREAARVLRPGGTFVFTVPSEYFTHFLSIAAGLRRVGLDRAADSYEDWFNAISRHYHCDPPEVWHARLAEAGLRTIRWQYYFSAEAHHKLEWGHYLGLPAVVSKAIFGRWVIAPWRSSLQWTERWLRPSYQETPPVRGAYLVFVAQKVEPGADAGRLPPPAPRDYSALEKDAAPIATPMLSDEAPVDDRSMERLPVAELPPAAVPHRPAAPAARTGSLIWLLLAVLLAVIGQVSWNWQERPFEPADGFVWYALALLAFAVFVWRSGERSASATVKIQLSAEKPIRWVQARFLPLLFLGWGLALSFTGWLAVGDAVKPEAGPLPALLFWLAGIGLATVALWPGSRRRLDWLGDKLFGREAVIDFAGPGSSARSHAWPGGPWQEGWLLIGLVLVAFLLRFVELATIPYVLAGDEASMGLEAVRVLTGELANPFITGWFSHPTLFYFILALPVKLLGQTVFAVRLLSPFVGALTVAATFVFARRAWGRPVAWLSAVLLAGYHFHIHYSRLALNNIWDPLFALLVPGLLWQGWERSDRRFYVLGGLALGTSQYFYMGSRMLLILVGALLLYWLAADRRKWWGQRFNLAALLALALVVGLPIILYSVGHLDDYMARVNQLGIYQSGWLEREIEITGRSETSLLWEQLWKSALAFNYTVDPTFWYRPGIPLLRFWPSILFAFGLLLTLAGIKKTANVILLFWVGATVLFGGFLLENPPSSQRYVIAAPAVCMLVGLALAWLGARLRSLLGGRPEVWAAGMTLITFWFVGGDVRFYFATYTPHGDYGGWNTEVAHRTADYLNDLGPEWSVYFYGPPRMGIAPQGGFPSVPFLVPHVSAVDVWEPLADPDVVPAGPRPTVYLFLPERAVELDVVRGAFPGGTEKHFPGRGGRMLFIAYEVP